MDKQSRKEEDQKALEGILGSHMHANDSQNVKPTDYCLFVIISQEKEINYLSFNDVQSK